MGNGMRTEVRKHYARVAKSGQRGTTADSCCGTKASCCGGSNVSLESESVGYGAEQLGSIPAESDMGLGCGNPTALGELRQGETVVDLGSGGGIDCFLAAKRVGDNGKVIGVDMTPEMIDRARAAALKGDYANVEFRLGEIESLPLADKSADVVISNCVINLSTEKERVFNEAFRVLRSGGRAMISDIMLIENLPERLKENVALFAGCVSGAILKEDYLRLMRDAGFSDVTIVQEKPTGDMFGPQEEARLLKAAHGLTREDLRRIGRAIVSVQLTARA